MRFDPNTLGMCKKEISKIETNYEALQKEIADEISKVIDLNELEFGDSLVDTIFGLFVNGGGEMDAGMALVNQILSAFENKTFVEQTVSAVGYKIKCPLTLVNSTVDGSVAQVSFTFLMDYSGVKRVTVFLLANSSNNLRVLVESL